MAAHLLCLPLLFAQVPDDPTGFIDRELAAQWKTEKLTPAERSIASLEFAGDSLLTTVETFCAQLGAKLPAAK